MAKRGKSSSLSRGVDVRCGGLEMFRRCSRHPRQHISMSRIVEWRAWVNPGSVLASQSCPARWLAHDLPAGSGSSVTRHPLREAWLRLEKIPGCHVPVRPWRCNTRGSATPANSNGRAGFHHHRRSDCSGNLAHFAVLERASRQRSSSSAPESAISLSTFPRSDMLRTAIRSTPSSRTGTCRLR